MNAASGSTGTPPLDEASTVLLQAFVAVYEPYVASRLAGVPGAEEVDVRAAIVAGREWLGEHLAALLAEPYRTQRRSPLEVFQEALAAPTAALDDAGVAPVRRDPAVSAALPGDTYGLAPASSQELGDGVWQAHLAWGATKAAAMRRSAADRPRVGLYGADLMDRTRVEGVVRDSGCDLVIWRHPGDIDDAALGLVDLTHGEADEAIAALAARGVRTVAFGPHVDDVAMARAGALGADEVLARSSFFRRLPELVPRVA